jgi:hypothetical protein
MSKLIIALLIVVGIAIPNLGVAQTIGDVNKVMREANDAVATCPPKKDSKPGQPPDTSSLNCLMTFNSIAFNAGMLAMKRLNEFGKDCTERMAKDLRDSACGELYLKHKESISLEHGDLATLALLRKALADAKTKKF